MQRKTHILILCNQTGVEDLGSPKSPILDSPREGEKVQVKKSPFCTRELSPQAPCLPQLMAFMIEPPRFMPPFSGPVQQKGKVGHREERAVTYMAAVGSDSRERHKVNVTQGPKLNPPSDQDAPSRCEFLLLK